ncbi:MAG: thioredoxin-dependent thiol peroxidase [Verrucomicrobia bacterium]|nr:MAG: thioredoxin-dependent thiol peroxidase [Verrucomicrobiota bacterium]
MASKPEPPLTLKPGDPAPDFRAPIQDGSEITLEQFRGRPVVLYFYPRDNTPGCTTEACGFRDHWAEIQAAGAVVLGVSPDTVARHANFAAKHDLPFPLVADPDKKILRAYGVYGPKQFMGRVSEGVHRVTFLIDPRGRIARIWPKVKVKEHAQEVLEALRELA